MPLSHQLRRPLCWPAALLWLQPWVVIFGGFLIHITLGSLYTFGNMAPYIVAYVRNQSHPSDLRPATSSWIYALNLGGQGGSMFVGGLLARKIGPRWSSLIGSLTLSVGVFLSCLAIRVSFFLLLLTYGALVGVGIGVAYVGPIMCAMCWLPRWKGVASGAVVSGFGLGALVFDAIQTSYINPNNHPPEEWAGRGVLQRVPTTFLILGGCYVALQLLGCVFLFSPPQDTEEPPQRQVVQPPLLASGEHSSGSQRTVVTSTNLDSDVSDSAGDCEPGFTPSEPSSTPASEVEASVEKEEEREGNNHRGSRLPQDANDEKWYLLSSEELGFQESLADSLSSLPSSKGKERWRKVRRRSSTINIITSLPPRLVLRQTNFYLLYFMFFFNSIPIVFTATLYKFFAFDAVTSNDRFLAIVGSVAAVFNWLGRILWGLLADKTSHKSALVVLAGAMTAFLLTFYVCTAGGKAMLFVWVCLLFFCIGGNFTLFPTAIARCFGPQHFGANYGLLFTSQVVSAVLSVTLSQVLQEHLPWFGIMFLMAGLSAGGLLLAMLYRPKRYIRLSRHKSPTSQCPPS